MPTRVLDREVKDRRRKKESHLIGHFVPKLGAPDDAHSKLYVYASKSSINQSHRLIALCYCWNFYVAPHRKGQCPSWWNDKFMPTSPWIECGLYWQAHAFCNLKGHLESSLWSLKWSASASATVARIAIATPHGLLVRFSRIKFGALILCPQSL